MKTIKKLLIFIPFIAVLLLQQQVCQAQEINRNSFYAALASADLTTINNELAILEKTDGKLNHAFKGALMMKKAGLLNGVGKKLKEFKAGREILENSLEHEPGNTEFRFLRLMIQENAPKILGYSNQLENDHEYLRKNFKNLPPQVQQVVLDYSKTSKVLKLSDF